MFKKLIQQSKLSSSKTWTARQVKLFPQFFFNLDLMQSYENLRTFDNFNFHSSLIQSFFFYSSMYQESTTFAIKRITISFILQDIEDIKESDNIHMWNTFVKIIDTIIFFNPTKCHIIQIKSMPFEIQVMCSELVRATTVMSGVNIGLQFGVFFVCSVQDLSICFHVCWKTGELYASGRL